MVKRDKTKKDTCTVSGLLEMLERGEIRDDHPEQRQPDRWSNIIRDGFIATIIKEEDVDSIKICEQVYENGVDNWLIDGLQRLTTLKKFKLGAFRLGKNIELPVTLYQVAKKDENGRFICNEDGHREYDTIEFDLRGKGYGDLPKELQTRFVNYPIDIVKHLSCSDEEVGYHIRRYNNKVNMNSSEKAITYLDRIAKRVKDLSCHRFFMDCSSFTETDRNNGTVDKTVMESLMFINYQDKWKKGAREQGIYLNEYCTNKEFDAMEKLLDRLEIVVEDRYTDLFTSKNTLVWLKTFHNFSQLGLDDKEFGRFLDAFYDGLKDKEVILLHSRKPNKIDTAECTSYVKLDSSKSSKDKGYLQDKMHILDTLMAEFFSVGNVKVFNEMSDIDFVKDTVCIDVDEEDMELYDLSLSDYTIDVDNSSVLMEGENKRSLLAIIAYAFANESDNLLPKWFIQFFNKHKSYNKDQKKNYVTMKEDFDHFVQISNASSAA